MKQHLKISNEIDFIVEHSLKGITFNVFYKGVNSPFFLHKTKKSKNLCELESIESDMDQTLLYIRKYQKDYGADDNLIKNSLWRTIVMYYARGFSGPSKVDNKPLGRRLKIGIEKVKLTEDELKIHNQMINWRNNYVAHSGHAPHMYNYNNVVILNPDMKHKKVIESVVISYDSLGFDMEKIFPLLKTIIKKIKVYLEHRMEGSSKHVRDEIDKLDLKELYKQYKDKL